MGRDLLQHCDFNESISRLGERLRTRTAKVGVIGLGYVGLPLAEAVASTGYPVLGFDIDPQKIEMIAQGKTYFRHFSGDRLKSMLKNKFSATTDFSRLHEMDVILVCVPTPITHHRDPDLTFVVATARTIAKSLRPGQLIVLESTTYPGTTTDLFGPILKETGLQNGVDFLLAYSPEREDPGNRQFSAAAIPKVVGADDEAARLAAGEFYGSVFSTIVSVSSTATAEAAKLTENIFRAVNIALVNELKTIFAEMGIDVWEVIEAAKSKPFGFMPFYPGPGLGGHCIPIDPYYLSWKAREYGVAARFIELAGEINTAMPIHVVEAISMALSNRLAKSLNKANVLLLGLAYKKNIDDIRESPAFRVMSLLHSRGALVKFYDPYVSIIPVTREYAEFAGQQTIEFSQESLVQFDCAVVVTDHDDVDYAMIERYLPIIVDTRNIFTRLSLPLTKVVKA
jgi:UDP-N-acetyl-D-glucosamine dehydrogenase